MDLSKRVAPIQGFEWALPYQHFNLRFSPEHGEKLVITGLHEFYDMGQRTVLSVFIFTQVPNDRRYEIDRALDKKITRFTDPLLVQAQHNSTAGFRRIRNIRHALR